jgi:4'-phosphopantetheinyl transferase
MLQVEKSQLVGNYGALGCTPPVGRFADCNRPRLADRGLACSSPRLSSERVSYKYKEGVMALLAGIDRAGTTPVHVEIGDRRHAASPMPATPDAIHVWKIELGIGPEVFEASLALLSLAERERAACLKVGDVRRSFVAARAGLRTVLAHYVGVPASALSFRVGEYGKPLLLGSDNLRFNVAHSGALGLVAVTAEREVGIDIEALRPIVGAQAIVERFFSPAERREYSAQSSLASDRAFLRIWTRKEALLKATGVGFSREPSGAEFDNDAARWKIVSFVPAVGYVAAAAILGEEPQMAFFSTACIGPDADAKDCHCGMPSKFPT